MSLVTVNCGPAFGHEKSSPLPKGSTYGPPGLRSETVGKVVGGDAQHGVQSARARFQPLDRIRSWGRRFASLRNHLLPMPVASYVFARLSDSVTSNVAKNPAAALVRHTDSI